jgi:hypothetical protein
MINTFFAAGDRMSEQLANWNAERDPYDNHAEVRQSMGSNRRQADPYRLQNQQNQEVLTNSYTSQLEASVADVFQDMENDQQEEEYQVSVMYEAQARIEQANLYQTLLNHDLFGPGSARPNILEKVQSEVKDFVLTRLEELLGMKSAEVKNIVSSPFDDEEVSALKALAGKVLKRDINQAPVPEVRQVQAPVPQMVPVINQTWNKPQINPATVPAQVKPKKPIVRPIAKTESKPVAKKPIAPVKPLTAEEMATMTPERAAELVASRQTKKAATTGKGKPNLTIEQLQRIEQEQAQRSAMNIGGSGGASDLIQKAIAASLKQ